MDFSRAKTVLILVFFCLNLFLGYQILEAYQVVSVPGDWHGDVVNHKERLEQALEEHNYELKGKLPRKTYEKAFLMVNPPSVHESKIKDRFLKEESEEVSRKTTSEKRTYQHFEGTLTVYNTGFYSFEPSPGNVDNKSEEGVALQEAKNIAEDFMEEYQLKADNARQDLVIEHEEDKFKVYYYQEWNGIPVYASYVMVKVSEGKVSRVESYWLEPDGTEEGRKMEVLPAASALVRFLEEKGASYQGRVIKEVELGYYSREYDAEQWEMPPVWRVVMKDGEVYFLNAFTGNLENEIG